MYQRYNIRRTRDNKFEIILEEVQDAGYVKVLNVVDTVSTEVEAENIRDAYNSELG